MIAPSVPLCFSRQHPVTGTLHPPPPRPWGSVPPPCCPTHPSTAAIKYLYSRQRDGSSLGRGDKGGHRVLGAVGEVGGAEDGGGSVLSSPPALMSPDGSG